MRPVIIVFDHFRGCDFTAQSGCKDEYSIQLLIEPIRVNLTLSK